MYLELRVAEMLTEFDGVLLSSWRFEGGKLVRKQTQPSRELILDHNAELKKNPDALRHLSFAGLELNIPMLDLIVLQKKYPALASSIGQERKAAWLKFMGSSESDPYRVRDRRKKRAKS